jgi:hypothetical protein
VFLDLKASDPVFPCDMMIKDSPEFQLIHDLLLVASAALPVHHAVVPTLSQADNNREYNEITTTTKYNGLYGKEKWNLRMEELLSKAQQEHRVKTTPDIWFTL